MIGQHLGDEIPLLWIRISLDKPDPLWRDFVPQGVRLIQANPNPQQRDFLSKVLAYHVGTHFKALKKFL